MSFQYERQRMNKLDMLESLFTSDFNRLVTFQRKKTPKFPIYHNYNVQNTCEDICKQL